MMQPPPRRPRNREQEEYERNCYGLLEKLYLLASADSRTVVSREDVEQELDVSWTAVTSLTDELARLGYVDLVGRRPDLRLTDKAVEYLRRRAWRRRSVRN